MSLWRGCEARVGGGGVDLGEGIGHGVVAVHRFSFGS